MKIILDKIANNYIKTFFKIINILSTRINNKIDKKNR